MRSVLILSLSAALLGGCLTTQENPNYEFSTAYKGDPVGQTQTAQPETLAATSVSYDTAVAQTMPAQGLPGPTANMPMAPTDLVYGTRDVSGTPGFMAMESGRQAVALEAASQALPAAEIVPAAPLGAAGTPIAYDYSRNLVRVDAAIDGQKIPEKTRVVPGYAQTSPANYTVKQGDTVYSLARKTCVGVSVIQSMNGLNSDFAIKIGQSLTLPASVC